MSFIDLTSLGLAATSSDLLEIWQDYMQSQIDGYQPATAALEYIDAQANANVLADVAQVGVVVPPAIVRAFGTKLYGVQYLTGAAANAVIDVAAVDAAGYTLPAGTGVLLNGTAFETIADLTIPPGSTTGSIVAAAVTPGSASNGAGNPTSFVNTIDWVLTVSTAAASSGGVDAEDDTTYQNRLAQVLALQAPRPITASDYATMALSFQPASGTDQEEVGRASALDGYSPAPQTFAVTANGTSTLTVTSAPAAGITAAPGASITGTDIASGALVQSSTSSSIVMTKAATGSGSGIATSVSGTLGNERTITVAVTDASGNALNSDTQTAVAMWLASYREVNFVVNVISPTYTPVYVNLTGVYLYPGFDPAATASAIQQSIINFLSPGSFGLPTYGDQQTWLAGTVIYYNELIGIIQNAAQGAVRAVADGALQIGLSASPTETTDLVIPGPLGLPTSSTATVSLPTILTS